MPTPQAYSSAGLNGAVPGMTWAQFVNGFGTNVGGFYNPNGTNVVNGIPVDRQAAGGMMLGGEGQLAQMVNPTGYQYRQYLPDGTSNWFSQGEDGSLQSKNTTDNSDSWWDSTGLPLVASLAFGAATAGLGAAGIGVDAAGNAIGAGSASLGAGTTDGLINNATMASGFGPGEGGLLNVADAAQTGLQGSAADWLGLNGASQASQGLIGQAGDYISQLGQQWGNINPLLRTGISTLGGQAFSGLTGEGSDSSTSNPYGSVVQQYSSGTGVNNGSISPFGLSGGSANDVNLGGTQSLAFPTGATTNGGGLLGSIANLYNNGVTNGSAQDYSNILGGAGSLLNGVLGYTTAQNGINAQTNAANQNNALQAAIYANQTALAKPFVDGGTAAFQQQSNLNGLNGTAAQTSAMGQFKTDPGYQFALDQGNRGVQSSAAAQGGLYSGRAAKDLTNYNQGMANQQYGNYYNRLSGQAGIGQAAVAGQAANGNAYANGVSNNNNAIGNAQTAGGVAGTNAITGSVNGLLNQNSSNQLLNLLLKNQGTGNGYYPSGDVLMPQLDASLIGGYKPIDIPDPINQLAKFLQLSGLQQQNQSGALKLQQDQQSADETNALRRYLSNPANQGQDPNALRAGVQRVAPIAGQTFLKNMLDTQKTQGDIQGTVIGNADKGRTAVASLAGALSQKPDLSPEDLMRFTQEAAKLGVQITPKDLARATDVDSARQALKRYQAQGLTADQQITQNNPTILPTEQGIAAVNRDGSGGRMVPNITGAASYPNGQPGIGPGVAPMQSSPANFPRVTPAMQVSRDGDRLAILRDELTKETNPEARAAIQSEIARTTATQAAGTPFGGQQVAQAQPQPQAAPMPLGGKPSGTWEKDPLTGQMVYAPKFANPGDTLTPGGVFKPTQADQALIDQIGKYQIAPPNANAIRNPHEAAILSEVAKQYPSFDATEFPARQKALRDFSTGPQGNALRSVSVASDHLSQLADVADAMKNGNIPLLNKLSNLYTTNTGGTAPNTFDAMKQIVGDEVVKAILGEVLVESTTAPELAARLSAASSPAQLSEVIRSYRDLMGAQKDGLVSQYENTTHRTDAATRFNFGKKSGVAVPAGWNVQVVDN